MIIAPEPLITERTNVLLLPVAMWRDQGGMPEIYRSWREHYAKVARGVSAPDRFDPRIAPLNKRGFHYFLGTAALLLGIRGGARCAANSFRKLATAMPATDVVHIFSFPITIDIVLQGLLSNVPNRIFIVTLHDPRPHTESTTVKKRLLYERVVNNVWQLSASFPNFYVHVFNRQLLAEVDVPPMAKVYFREHPLPVCRAARNRRDNLIRIGFLGRIEPYKGLHVLFRALRLMEQMLPQEVLSSIVIVVAGSGKLDENAINDLHFPSLVHNHFLTDDEFHQHMANLDILVLPYTEATQSGVVAMGLAYEKRLVASAVGGIPDLVKHNPLTQLVPPNDAAQLASALATQVNSVCTQIESVEQRDSDKHSERRHEH